MFQLHAPQLPGCRNVTVGVTRSVVSNVTERQGCHWQEMGGTNRPQALQRLSNICQTHSALKTMPAGARSVHVIVKQCQISEHSFVSPHIDLLQYIGGTI